MRCKKCINDIAIKNQFACKINLEIVFSQRLSRPMHFSRTIFMYIFFFFHSFNMDYNLKREIGQIIIITSYESLLRIA